MGRGPGYLRDYPQQTSTEHLLRAEKCSGFLGITVNADFFPTKPITEDGVTVKIRQWTEEGSEVLGEEVGCSVQCGEEDKPHPS